MREMKDSGVEWIGKIPKDWKVQRLKAVLCERNEPNNPVKTDFILSLTNDRGVIPYTEKGDVGNKSKDDLTGYKLAYPDDIVLNSMNVIIGSVDLSRYFGCVSPVYYMLYKRSKQDEIKYFNYLFQTRELQNRLKGYGNGIMEIRMRIQMSKLNTVLLPVPSSDEQTKIASYLDSKCSKIDAIIEKQQTVIEKLKEYKLSLITEVVTKGLNPDVPMKDSGVEWIGDIPEHWDVPKTKYIASIYSGATPDRNKLEYWNGEINWFKTGELQNNEIYYSEEKITRKALNETSVKMFYEDTILMAMYGQGKTRGMTALLKTQGTTNQACAGIIINNKKMSVKYMWEFLKGAYNAIRQEAIGSGQPNLSGKLIADFHVTMPPIKEQGQIADFLDRKCFAIDAVITKKQAIIEKLTACKKSLIYEVVTGKKEV